MGNNVVKLATYDNGIGRDLHPDTEYGFSSILGNIYSLGNAMRFLRYERALPAILNNKMSYRDYKAIRKSKLRDVPNYWNIITLLATDRVLSDMDLIHKEYDLYKSVGDDLNFIPYIKVKRAAIIVEKENKNIKKLGDIYNYLFMNINEYINGVERDTDIDMDNFKTSIKETMYELAMENRESEFLLEGLESIYEDNEGLKEAFIINNH